MSAGGRAGAANAHRRQQAAIENRKRHIAVQAKRKARGQTAVLVFSQLSSEDDTLPVSLVPQFLADVMKVPKENLQSDAVQLVIDSAQKLQKSTDLKKNLQKDALLASLEKYGEYVSNSDTIDRIFKKFDKSQDGYLTRADLRLALDDYEAHHDRYVRGVSIRLIITDQDLDFILEQSDVTHNGKIDHAELLPALAAWEELANIKLDEKQNSPCCIVL